MQETFIFLNTFDIKSIERRKISTNGFKLKYHDEMRHRTISNLKTMNTSSKIRANTH